MPLHITYLVRFGVRMTVVMSRSFIGFIGLIFIVLCNINAHAHGGRLNKQGCHNDRKRGTYHCHRGSSYNSSSTTAPARKLNKNATFENAGNSLLVMRIQTILQKLKYYHGPVNGLKSERLIESVRKYQLDVGVEADGKLSQDLLEHMQNELAHKDSG